MSVKVSYYEEILLASDGALGRSYIHKSPLDELMEKEEGGAIEDEPARDESIGWLLTEVMEWIFADERPMDWRYAGKRGLSLIMIFAPGLLTGRATQEIKDLETLTAVPPVPGKSRRLREAVADETVRLRIRKLLEWIYDRQRGEWLKEGTRKIYVLARGYHQKALKREREGRVVRQATWKNSPDQPGEVKLVRSEAWEAEKMIYMSYDDFAAAFGEKTGGGSRARWSWRGKQILEGTPHVPFQKSQETIERCRAAALGNGNRKKNLSNGN